MYAIATDLTHAIVRRLCEPRRSRYPPRTAHTGQDCLCVKYEESLLTFTQYLSITSGLIAASGHPARFWYGETCHAAAEMPAVAASEAWAERAGWQIVARGMTLGGRGREGADPVHACGQYPQSCSSHHPWRSHGRKASEVNASSARPRRTHLQ
jgi:hypothetical protein